MSAVKLDAPPGLISGSPIFLFFKLTLGSCTISSSFPDVPSLIASPLSIIACSILLGTPRCAAQFQHNLGILQYVRTYPKCSVASTTFSHVCRLPTHPFAGLLVPAACTLLPHSTDCQHTDSRIANPKIIITFKTSHTACLHCTCWRKEQEFIGTVKLTDTPRKRFEYFRIHLMFNLVPPSDFTVSYHPTHQYMIKSNFCLVFSLRRLLEMHEAVPELSTTIRFVTV